MRPIATQLAVFVAGAVVGTLLDRTHVAAEVLGYARPALFGQAVWVPLVFGVGGVVLVNAHRLFPPAASERASGRAIAAGVAGLVLAYLATDFWTGGPVLLALVLALAWAARLARTPSADRVAAGTAFAIGGPLVEAALAATGGFSYTRPDVLGVPIWLPGLYLHASLLTRAIYLRALR